MLLLFHLTAALMSIIISTVTLARPSQAKLKTSYALTATTFVSGSYLVYVSKSSLLKSCISGIVYLAIVSGLTAAARYRLAHEHESNN